VRSNDGTIMRNDKQLPLFCCTTCTEAGVKSVYTAGGAGASTANDLASHAADCKAHARAVQVRQHRSDLKKATGNVAAIMSCTFSVLLMATLFLVSQTITGAKRWSPEPITEGMFEALFEDMFDNDDLVTMAAIKAQVAQADWARVRAMMALPEDDDVAE
jgi:hypothetical protein